MTAPILGIWGYSSDVPNVLHHDSGAAIVANGEIVAALNEERITRTKNEGRWPSASIEGVLRLANLAPSDVKTVAMAGMTPFRRGAAVAAEVARLFARSGILLPNRLLYAALTTKKIRRHGPEDVTARVRFVPHHYAHASSAYYTAPFDDCTVVTLDGIGDSAYCGSVWAGRDERLTFVRHFSGYASIGLLYSAVTKAFGFRPARHEGKVTGLAGRGDPDLLIAEFRKRLSYDSKKRRLISDFIPTLFRSGVDAEWKTRWIDELMEKHSREDIAAALQKHTEDLCAAIARDALADTGMKNVALAGGVFANVRVNQVIRESSEGQLWIHPNMGDGGLAAGAALALTRKRCPLENAYLGDEPGDLAGDECDLIRVEKIMTVVARALAQGLIVGRAAGRMEYGPRALGNRTIFVSADDPTINDTLNKRLRRTEFMPFAPIMTELAAKRYLVNWSRKDAPSRYMTMTYRVTDACRADAPAIVHVDGTARPQVVSPISPASAPLHELLVEYGKLTGKEILINTSFNIHEEPIVRTAQDAVRSWRAGAVDLLAFENSLAGDAEVLKKIL